MRIDMDEHAILESAGFHLIGIDNKIPRKSPICGNGLPFFGSRKTCAAPAPEAGLLDSGGHLSRWALPNEIFKRPVAATPAILIEGGDAIGLTILEEYLRVCMHHLFSFGILGLVFEPGEDPVDLFVSQTPEDPAVNRHGRCTVAITNAADRKQREQTIGRRSAEFNVKS
jgi:hypothetical protein